MDGASAGGVEPEDSSAGVERSGLGRVPWGIFWHWNASTETGELSTTEVTNLIGDLKTSGATIANTGLVNWLQGGTQVTGTDGNYYYALPANSMVVNFGPTKNSPVVNAGQNLGTAYALDINGVNQNSYGSSWDIGAHVYQGYAIYGGRGGAGISKIGGAPNLPFLATLPQVWVNGYEGDSLFSYELSLPGTWVTGPAPDALSTHPTGRDRRRIRGCNPQSTTLKLAERRLERASNWMFHRRSILRRRDW